MKELGNEEGGDFLMKNDLDFLMRNNWGFVIFGFLIFKFKPPTSKSHHFKISGEPLLDDEQFQSLIENVNSVDLNLKWRS